MLIGEAVEHKEVSDIVNIIGSSYSKGVVVYSNHPKINASLAEHNYERCIIKIPALPTLTQAGQVDHWLFTT